MRKLSLVFSSLLALLVSGLLLAYAPRYLSGQRVYVDDRPPIALDTTLAVASF
jgi:hypothetical protein